MGFVCCLGNNTAPIALPLMIQSVVGGARTRNADFDPLLSSPLLSSSLSPIAPRRPRARRHAMPKTRETPSRQHLRDFSLSECGNRHPQRQRMAARRHSHSDNDGYHPLSRSESQLASAYSAFSAQVWLLHPQGRPVDLPGAFSEAASDVPTLLRSLAKV